MFNSGILATGPVDGAHFDYGPASPEVLGKVAAMQRIAAEHGTSLAAAAMQFPLQHPAVASVLIGTARPSSVTRNMALLETALAPNILNAFDGETLVAPPLGEDAVRE